MRKIDLKVDSLAVESFQTVVVTPAAAGTVGAHEVTANCPVYSDAVRNTAYASCQVICDCTQRFNAC